jgi:hypothetical protein
VDVMPVTANIWPAQPDNLAPFLSMQPQNVCQLLL